jgi:hypothetical protein
MIFVFAMHRQFADQYISYLQWYTDTSKIILNSIGNVMWWCPLCNSQHALLDVFVLSHKNNSRCYTCCCIWTHYLDYYPANVCVSSVLVKWYLFSHCIDNLLINIYLIYSDIQYWKYRYVNGCHGRYIQ